MPTDAPDGLVNAYVVHAAPKAPKKAAAPVSVEEKATVVPEAHPVKKAAAKKTSTK